MEVLLEVKNLQKYFPIHKGWFGRDIHYVKAVDDVSFKIYKGETLGLVGESGCGKSTTGKMLVNLLKPTGGEVLFEGKNITGLKGSKRREFCKDIQIIFQDPYASLNPRMTIGDIIAEPIRVNRLASGPDLEKSCLLYTSDAADE
ncbi:MAG: ATP-binding cassette domain-containing protein, partial [Atribacterota bacterium]|nr:ATP-binding cassette domain-containing protein [Atribacterota bacterium]